MRGLLNHPTIIENPTNSAPSLSRSPIGTRGAEVFHFQVRHVRDWVAKCPLMAQGGHTPSRLLALVAPMPGTFGDRNEAARVRQLCR
jgi:hypothetical protein